VAEPDPQLRRIERNAVIACLAMAVAAWGLARGGWMAPAGVVAGGALVSLSYRGIKAGIDALVAATGTGATRAPVVVGLVKFLSRYALLAVVAYVTMIRLRLPPVAVFAGASSFVVAVSVEALRGVLRRGDTARDHDAQADPPT
jgi:hypothetical protein